VKFATTKHYPSSPVEKPRPPARRRRVYNLCVLETGEELKEGNFMATAQELLTRLRQVARTRHEQGELFERFVVT